MKCQNRKVVNLAPCALGVCLCLCMLYRPKVRRMIARDVWDAERKLSWHIEGKLLLICYEYFCCLSRISGMRDQPEINMQLNCCEKVMHIIV